MYDDDRDVFRWLREGAPDGRRCLEAQVMDWSDDIAYSVHDLEDAIHARHLELDVLRDPAERTALTKLRGHPPARQHVRRLRSGARPADDAAVLATLV